MLLTNLANSVQPLIRYDLGDSVVAAVGPCHCGSPLPGITVNGRNDDVLRFTDDRGRVVVIPPLAIGAAANKAPGVHRTQLVQTSPTELRIRMEVQPPAEPDETWLAVRSRVASYLRAQGLGEVGIVRATEPPETSRSGKYRHVIAAGPHLRGRAQTGPDPCSRSQGRTDLSG